MIKIKYVGKQAEGEMRERAYKEACALLDARDFRGASAQFLRNLERWPADTGTQINLGISYLGLKQYDQAARLFHELHKTDTRNKNYLLYCGIAFEKLGAFKEAEEFLLRHNSIDKKNYIAWMTLASAYNRSKNYIDALRSAMEALALEPTRSDAYNNIGAALIGVEKFSDALEALNTSLDLSPGDIDVESNIATIYEKIGNYDEAINWFDKLISRPDLDTDRVNEIKYRSSFAYLASGQLEEGWSRYDKGLELNELTSRLPNRKFSVPQWHGEDISESTLLVWAEQGLGDELRFFSLLAEAQASCKKLVVQCDKRLVGLLQTSFPEVVVSPTQMYPRPQGVEIPDGCDFHIPAGSLMGIFRKNVSDFTGKLPYIFPPKHLKDEFKNRLEKYAGFKLVGISWKSGVINPQRRKHSLYLQEMESILQIRGVKFVNLQYGDCESEISEVERSLGIEIIRWDDVDLKDDQDKLAAIISNLDAVVTIGTAVGEMALAVGGRCYMYGRERWLQLGEENFVWSKDCKFFPEEPDKNPSLLIERIKKQMLIDMADDNFSSTEAV